MQGYCDFLLAEISHEKEQENRNNYILMALYTISKARSGFEMPKPYHEIIEQSKHVDNRTGEEIYHDVLADFDKILERGQA